MHVFKYVKALKITELLSVHINLQWVNGHVPAVYFRQNNKLSCDIKVLLNVNNSTVNISCLILYIHVYFKIVYIPNHNDIWYKNNLRKNVSSSKLKINYLVHQEGLYISEDYMFKCYKSSLNYIKQGEHLMAHATKTFRIKTYEWKVKTFQASGLF